MKKAAKSGGKIVTRKDELFVYMDEFLAGIRSFESNAA